MTTRIRYEFVGKPPLAFQVVCWTAMVNFAAGWLLGVSRSLWASQYPDPRFLYAIKYKGGHVWYFPSALGWYLDSFILVHIAFMALAFLVMWIYRDQVRRVVPETAVHPTGPYTSAEFFTSLIIAPIILCSVGEVFVFQFSQGFSSVGKMATSVPLLLLSLVFVKHTLGRFAARRPLPLSARTCYAITFALAALTMLAMAQALDAILA